MQDLTPLFRANALALSVNRFAPRQIHSAAKSSRTSSSCCVACRIIAVSAAFEQKLKEKSKQAQDFFPAGMLQGFHSLKRRFHMEEGRPSVTAIGAAMIRAAHLLLDGEPKILRDDLALGLSGIANEAALRAAVEGLRAEIAQRTDRKSTRLNSSHLG